MKRLHIYSISILIVLLFGNVSAAWAQFTEISDLAGLNAMQATGSYKIVADIDATGYTATIDNFSGTLTSEAKADGTFPVVSNLQRPLFRTLQGGKVSNIMLRRVTISQDGNAGAVCNTARGASRIYNCGILPTPDGGPSTIHSNNANCGSLVGQLNDNSRVINCFSFANVSATPTANRHTGGVVGYNSTAITQDNVSTASMVMNCMFYGEVTNGQSIWPVYGGRTIKTDATNGVNPYDYFRADAAFDDNYPNISNYNRCWPAEEEYLTRFEYYRSILNSNRLLCTWWVNGTVGTAPTDADVEAVGIAKWVLDPSIAPYPVLKKWGSYPSVMNIDPERVWNPQTGQWVRRRVANDYEGKQLGTLKVTIQAGDHHAGDKPSTILGRDFVVTDMDTLNSDYGYAKIQLPYYNELFGDPAVADDTDANHQKRYGGNYTDYVVTGWKITAIEDADDFQGTRNSFDGTSTKAWESGYNFADRNCTDKDLYSKSKRVFAQGGFFYVPEKVKAITIEAVWGKAVYLHNAGHYIDRVNITNQKADGTRKLGNPFTPAGTLSATYHGQTVYDSWETAVKSLPAATLSGGKLSLTVYDQAIVLLSNYQLRNENGKVGTDIDSKWHPYTIMSIDRDIDNEPDHCFELQFRNQFERPGIQPIRFDFLPVPELGLAVRHSAQQNTIGIFVPQGHFEITETAFMHTTQFEYDFAGTKVESPVILNGGHFEQIVVRKGNNNRTSYFLLGGHFRMLRFTPGRHPNRDNNGLKTRHCAVNAIGGDFPEFYLSGIYNTSVGVDADNPHCYINGGRFGIIAGAGYEPVKGNVTFQIDHALIREFYGGGINGSKPITGSIDVTINNSQVIKYCGGPKVGVMAAGVSTRATGTTFHRFYGGGNGGTSYYRNQKQDGNVTFINPSTEAYWNNYGYSTFNPLNTLSGTKTYEDTGENKGYHALFEFACFVKSNGLGASPTVRSYLHWAQFGTTSTGDVTNTLTRCTINDSFYGGGNLANVEGNVTSTLTGCTVRGDVLGGGFSGKIEPFRIHDKSKTEFPYIDKGGIMHNGHLYYVKNDDGSDRYYTWCYRKTPTEFYPHGVVIPATASTSNPTFQYDGKWYVLTTISLDNLGTVSGTTSLTINGATRINGSVFGGGDESAVDGNTSVSVYDDTHITGSVYGGGNVANVGGGGNEAAYTAPTGQTSPVLNIRSFTSIGEVYGGGYGASAVITGDTYVNIQQEAGRFAAQIDSNLDGEPDQDATRLGVIERVLGGGNAANVVGNTHVLIGTESDTANISGNVYGGGNNAEVSGNTNVVVGVPPEE